VAVAEGRDSEEVGIASKPVRLWGRCPARTVVVGAGLQRSAIPLVRDGASGSGVRGLAATGPLAGILVQGARSARATRSRATQTSTSSSEGTCQYPMLCR
jgi:hypothetical protein